MLVSLEVVLDFKKKLIITNLALEHLMDRGMHR